MVEKVMEKLVQTRLQLLAERVLPESHAVWLDGSSAGRKSH